MSTDQITGSSGMLQYAPDEKTEFMCNDCEHYFRETELIDFYIANGKYKIEICEDCYGKRLSESENYFMEEI